MDNTFLLKKGKIAFEKDRIVITDFAKYQKGIRLFTLSVGILLGVFLLLISFKTGEKFSIVYGLLTVISMMIPFLLELLYTTKGEIHMNEVKSMKVRRIYSSNILYIKLFNKKSRRVVGVKNPEELRKYIESI